MPSTSANTTAISIDPSILRNIIAEEGRSAVANLGTEVRSLPPSSMPNLVTEVRSLPPSNMPHTVESQPSLQDNNFSLQEAVAAMMQGENSMPYISNQTSEYLTFDLPLGAILPDKIKQRVMKGEFVDLV
jgi:hypothetical protein